MRSVLSVLLIFFIFSLLLIGFLHPITALSQDLGRHILTGNIILSTHHVPAINLFSYTYPSFPFINHHWLSEVVFSLITVFFGINGMFLFTLISIVTTFSLLFFSQYKKVSIFALALSSLFAIRILFERTDIRPELFSFLFLSIFVTLLYRYKTTYTRLIFLLIPLSLLWVNMHIYFFIGLITLFLFYLDYIFQERKKLKSAPVLTFSIVFMSSVLVSLVNPHGIQGLLYPFHVFQNYGYTIEENQTVFFLDGMGFLKPALPYFKGAVALLFFGLLVTYKKTRPIDWMLSIIFTILGFMAVRNLPLFAIATFIPFSLSLSEIGKKLSKNMLVKKYASIYPSILFLFFFCIYGLQIHTIVQTRGVGYGVDPGAEKAVDFYLNNHLHGPLFNNFDIGSYLEYRLYPRERVFVDGRPEAYPASFFSSVYIPMQENPVLFKSITDKYHINTIFFSHTDQTPWASTFLHTLIENPSWKLVYIDENSVIFVKNTKNNEQVIKRYGMNRNSLRITLSEKKVLSFMKLANFFITTGWPEKTQAMFDNILSLEPTNCIALKNNALLLASSNPQLATIYDRKYSLSCQ